MTNTAFEHLDVDRAFFEGIFSDIRENSTVIRDEQLRMKVVVENLMLRQYLTDPDTAASVFRKVIRPFCPDLDLTDLAIRDYSVEMEMDGAAQRRELIEWAVGIARKIYAGMAGNNDLLKEVNNALNRPYSPGRKRVHPMQHRLILFALFEFVPELRSSQERELLLQYGRKYSVRCLNKIINSALFDTSTGEERQRLGGEESVEQLRRELYLARKELKDYKELTEAADAEFEQRLERLKNWEITSFFSQLNDKEFGYLIDSFFNLSKSFKLLRKSKKEIPYEVESAPVVIDSLLSFLRKAGISPGTPYPPGTLLTLSLSQMDGYSFIPDPNRRETLTPESSVRVRVVSSGWKYKDVLISLPVFQEVNEREELYGSDK